MKNGLKIEWSEEAIRNLDSIIEYLTYRWTDREIKNFFVKLEKRLQTISLQPTSYPNSAQKPYVRRSVLSKQTTIFYSVIGDKLFIVSLFDTRQNPVKLNI
jgi:plasmid stabilization system protein ParE